MLDRPAAKRRKSGDGLSAASSDAAAADGASTDVRRSVARSPSVAASAAVETVTLEDAQEAGGADQPETAAGGAAKIDVAEVAVVTYVKGSKPRGLREKLGDRPLRLILVGHNPSEHAWYAYVGTAGSRDASVRHLKRALGPRILRMSTKIRPRGRQRQDPRPH